jgi:hypothetical protein
MGKMLNTKFLFSIQISALALAAVAYAGEGNRVGNGGNALICEIGSAKSVHLFDFQENGIDSLKLVQPTSEEALVTAAIKRLNSASARWATALERQWGTFKSRTEMKSGVELETILDSLHTDVPKGCKTKQMAIRREKPLPGQKDFVIDQDLFKQLSTVDKAGLYVHELLYEHFHKLGANDSRAVREINRDLFAKDFDEKALKTTVEKLKVPSY